jgi:hypothetical protein
MLLESPPMRLGSIPEAAAARCATAADTRSMLWAAKQGRTILDVQMLTAASSECRTSGTIYELLSATGVIQIREINDGAGFT